LVVVLVPEPEPLVEPPADVQVELVPFVLVPPAVPLLVPLLLVPAAPVDVPVELVPFVLVPPAVPLLVPLLLVPAAPADVPVEPVPFVLVPPAMPLLVSVVPVLVEVGFELLLLLILPEVLLLLLVPVPVTLTFTSTCWATVTNVCGFEATSCCTPGFEFRYCLSAGCCWTYLWSLRRSGFSETSRATFLCCPMKSWKLLT